MKAVILNGADVDSPAVDDLCAEVERQLAGQPAASRSFHLRHFAVGHCLGEFDCWVKTPGRCRIHDEGQEIERAVHDADLLVLLTPVSFGGYGAQLKKAIDRLIPLISPFFEKRADLTHHQHRYERLPRFVGIGWDSAPSAQRQRLFGAFVESNALNLGCPAWAAALVGEDRTSWRETVSRAMAACAAPGNASGSLDEATRVLHQMVSADPAPQRFMARPTVAILLCSARAAGTSTSESLASYLQQQVQREGGVVNIVSATALARDGVAAEHAARQLADADVLVIAAPLYVDSLPYLGVLALEKVRDARRGSLGRRPARLVGLLNCGFPEPEQLRFAAGLMREFAAEANYTWAGALAVGGGEAIHGRPLESTGGMTRHLRHALDAAAAALCAGDVVPDTASLGAAHPFIAPALYRLAGWWGWRGQGRSHGLRPKALRERPFDRIDDAEWERLAASGHVRARPLRVVEKIPEGADAVTLVFDDPAHHTRGFEAGQYLTLELPIGGDRVRRAYSLSGAPCDAELSITVKRVPGGLASNWIHDHLQVGALVRTFGPSGIFTAGARPEAGPRRLLLIAGGSGIVPLAVIAREILQTEPDAEVDLIYGSASLERAIFAAPLRHLAQVHAPRFRLRFVFETPPPGWSGATGRLDPQTLEAQFRESDLRAFQRAMLCGPDGMRAAARQTLLAHGFPDERIAEESFASPRRATDGGARQSATLHGAQGAPFITVEAGQTLLEAALDAGVPISFSCCSGGCGACRVRITGHIENVVLDEPNDVSAEDRVRGHVPACLVRLRGPIDFEII
jgi:ferredoxin-NADP reductase/NAD(P)H-dependent FMN reductase